MIKRTIGIAAVAGTALLGLLAGPALASTNEGTNYSEYLAGHALYGNGTQTYNAVWATPTLPDLGSSAAKNAIATGVVLTASPVAAGPTYGEALVWDAAPAAVTLSDIVTPSTPPSTPTCPDGTYTLEYGQVTTPTSPGVPMPVPVSQLQPLLQAGSPVCVSPGGKEFIKIQQSTRDHVVSFLAGTDANDDNVLLQDSGVHAAFEGAGEGITTTDGASAATIPTGTTFGWNTFAVNRLAAHNGGHATGIAVGVKGNGGDANYVTYEGTESGLAPTVNNPATLTSSGFTLVGFGTESTVTVP